MKIRSEQMEMLSNIARDEFVSDLSARIEHNLSHFLEHYGIANEDVNQVVLDGIAKAKTYGIERRGDVTRFVEAMIILGVDFDENEDHVFVSGVLRREDLDADEKIEQLSGYILLNWWEPSRD